MEWTNDYPTVKGWYWFNDSTAPNGAPEVVLVRIQKHPLEDEGPDIITIDRIGSGNSITIEQLSGQWSDESIPNPG